jgi:hypothetical protein
VICVFLLSAASLDDIAIQHLQGFAQAPLLVGLEKQTSRGLLKKSQGRLEAIEGVFAVNAKDFESYCEMET